MDIISERIDRRFNCSKILGETYEFSECISIDRDFNLSIYIHFETKYKDDFYFKVFNDVDFIKATKCCRIKIFKSMYKKQQIDDSMSFFILNEDYLFYFSLLIAIISNWYIGWMLCIFSFLYVIYLSAVLSEFF